MKIPADTHLAPAREAKRWQRRAAHLNNIGLADRVGRVTMEWQADAVFVDAGEVKA